MQLELIVLASQSKQKRKEHIITYDSFSSEIKIVTMKMPIFNETQVRKYTFRFLPQMDHSER